MPYTTEGDSHGPARCCIAYGANGAGVVLDERRRERRPNGLLGVARQPHSAVPEHQMGWCLYPSPSACIHTGQGRPSRGSLHLSRLRQPTVLQPRSFVGGDAPGQHGRHDVQGEMERRSPHESGRAVASYRQRSAREGRIPNENSRRYRNITGRAYPRIQGIQDGQAHDTQAGRQGWQTGKHIRREARSDSFSPISWTEHHSNSESRRCIASGYLPRF